MYHSPQVRRLQLICATFVLFLQARECFCNHTRQKFNYFYHIGHVKESKQWYDGFQGCKEINFFSMYDHDVWVMTSLFSDILLPKVEYFTGNLWLIVAFHAAIIILFQISSIVVRKMLVLTKFC